MGPTASHVHQSYPPTVLQALSARDPVNVIAAFYGRLCNKKLKAGAFTPEDTETAPSNTALLRDSRPGLHP